MYSFGMIMIADLRGLVKTHVSSESGRRERKKLSSNNNIDMMTTQLVSFDILVVIIIEDVRIET